MCKERRCEYGWWSSSRGFTNSTNSLIQFRFHVFKILDSALFSISGEHSSCAAEEAKVPSIRFLMFWCILQTTAVFIGPSLLEINHTPFHVSVKRDCIVANIFPLVSFSLFEQPDLLKLHFSWHRVTLRTLKHFWQISSRRFQSANNDNNNRVINAITCKSIALNMFYRFGSRRITNNNNKIKSSPISIV